MERRAHRRSTRTRGRLAGPAFRASELGPSAFLGSALLATMLFVGGCPGDDTAPGDASADRTSPSHARVELGTGEWRFEPLTDEQDVELVRGAQGGWHVWVSLRTEGLEPEGVQMELISQVLEPALPERPSYVTVDLDSISPEGTLGFLGWPAIQPDAECVVDHRLRLRVTLTDAEGAVVSDERVVVPRSDPETRPSEPCDPGS